KGKIVVVGSPVGDVHRTPTSTRPMMGAEIQANAIGTVRSRPAAGRDILLIALLALLPCAFLRVRAGVAAAALVAIAVAYLVAAQLLWNAGDVLPVAIPLGAYAFSCVGLIVIRRRLPQQPRQTGGPIDQVRALTPVNAPDPASAHASA